MMQQMLGNARIILSHTHTHHQNLTQMGRVRENFLLEYLDQLW
jgi:hypothetical protein